MKVGFKSALKVLPAAALIIIATFSPATAHAKPGKVCRGIPQYDDSGAYMGCSIYDNLNGVNQGPVVYSPDTFGDASSCVDFFYRCFQTNEYLLDTWESKKTIVPQTPLEY